MRKIVKKLMKFANLTILWIVRILGAPNHFKVNFFRRLHYNICGGFMADQCSLYNLNRHNKKEYLSEFDWYKSRYINGDYSFILNNKIVCTEILKHYVKVPDITVLKQDGLVNSYDGTIHTYDDVLALLREKGEFYIKPTGAGKGKGVCIISYNEGVYRLDEEVMSEGAMKAYLKKTPGWFLSDRVYQHDFLNKIYDKTSNTMRIITLRDIETDEWRVFFGVLRIGTHETIPVDNGSRGGLVSKIDLETGVLTEARTLHSLNVYKNHPDSGAPIEGVTVPGWDKIKTELVELAKHFPYLYFIAWDVLLTEEGICIIEANTSSGVNIIQLWGGQRNGELGDFYRHHNIIK